MTVELLENPAIPRCDDGEEDWREIPERVCLECGKPLTDEDEYEICDECIHGTPPKGDE